MPPRNSARGGARPAPSENPHQAVEIRRLLAKGKSKTAVDLAKDLHKASPTPATEALLLEAYAGRIRSMLEHNLAVEAEALVEMVRQRFPRAAGLRELEAIMAAHGGSLDDLVRPLADPAIGAEERAATERAIRTSVSDLSALAGCEALSPEHPLRRAAGALDRAFQAVTSGPAGEAVVALPEVSHRSPLAPWKALVRAIAAFYRNDDAACEQNLNAIHPESAPAQVVPVLRALLAGAGPDDPGPAEAALMARLGGGLNELREDLRAVEDALEYGEPKPVCQAIRQAMSRTQAVCPEMAPVLRQQVALRAMLLDLPPAAVTAAMGGAHRQDARYLLASARLLEAGPDQALTACMEWHSFLAAAVEERWFSAQGPEAAVVLLHMAGVAEEIEPEELAAIQRESRKLAAQSGMDDFEALYSAMPFLNAGWLFECACGMDPHAEAFQSWLRWAEQNPKERSPEEVAEAWARALPDDPRPLLRLAEYAEGRQALKKALGYLRQAEALDGLSPEVRRARLRLLVAGAIRHLQSGQLRPVQKELAELETLPQAREGDRPAFVTALRHVACVLAKDPEGAAAAGLKVHELLGGSRAGAFALGCVAVTCGLPSGVPAEFMRQGTGSWVEAVARVTAMGYDLGYIFHPPAEWQPRILEELRGGPPAEAGLLEKLGKAALKEGWRELAYAVSTAGLERTECEARFLMVRAEALPEIHGERRDECLAAAVELARRRHDAALAGEALDLRRRLSFLSALGLDDAGAPLSARDLQIVLERERRARNFPQSRSYGADPWGPPRQRRKRGKKAPPRPISQEDLF